MAGRKNQTKKTQGAQQQKQKENVSVPASVAQETPDPGFSYAAAVAETPDNTPAETFTEVLIPDTPPMSKMDPAEDASKDVASSANGSGADEPKSSPTKKTTKGANRSVSKALDSSVIKNASGGKKRPAKREPVTAATFAEKVAVTEDNTPDQTFSQALPLDTPKSEVSESELVPSVLPAAKQEKKEIVKETEKSDIQDASKSTDTLDRAAKSGKKDAKKTTDKAAVEKTQSPAAARRANSPPAARSGSPAAVRRANSPPGVRGSSPAGVRGSSPAGVRAKKIGASNEKLADASDKTGKKESNGVQRNVGQSPKKVADKPEVKETEKEIKKLEQQPSTETEAARSSSSDSDEGKGKKNLTPKQPKSILKATNGQQTSPKSENKAQKAENIEKLEEAKVHSKKSQHEETISYAEKASEHIEIVELPVDHHAYKVELVIPAADKHTESRKIVAVSDQVDKSLTAGAEDEASVDSSSDTTGSSPTRVLTPTTSSATDLTGFSAKSAEDTKTGPVEADITTTDRSVLLETATNNVIPAETSTNTTTAATTAPPHPVITSAVRFVKQHPYLVGTAGLGLGMCMLPMVILTSPMIVGTAISYRVLAPAFVKNQVNDASSAITRVVRRASEVS
ncbi:hypothetical protein DFS34DRAFT_618286 [Phlyctochytrium arcticum]|nr:hypothetical protein DFS34DRAFT_618286 [Phlyctochytrium arcticum]